MAALQGEKQRLTATGFNQRWNRKWRIAQWRGGAGGERHSAGSQCDTGRKLNKLTSAARHKTSDLLSVA
jgi:hypothetical protein